MKTFKPYFFSLHSYLTLVDNHYVEGRFLWLNHVFNGAGNLLWLAFEQLIKILIIQSRMEQNQITEIKIKNESGNKINVKFSDNEMDIKLRAKILDALFYQIDSKHNLNTLFKEFHDTTDINLSQYKICLEKINEFFKRRYVVNNGTSINPKMLDEIDELFFSLRSLISNYIPQSLIDEILFRKKYSLKEPIPFFGTLFLKNNFVTSRQYEDLIDKLPDGRIIAHNGIKSKEFPPEAYRMLLKEGYLIHLRYSSIV